MDLPSGRPDQIKARISTVLQSHQDTGNTIPYESQKFLLDDLVVIFGQLAKAEYRKGYAAGNATKNYRKTHKLPPDVVQEIKTAVIEELLGGRTTYTIGAMPEDSVIV